MKEAGKVQFIFLRSTVSRRGTIYDDFTKQKFLFDFVWQFAKAKILIQEKISVAAWALQNSKWDLIAKWFKKCPGFAAQGQLPHIEILSSGVWWNFLPLQYLQHPASCEKCQSFRRRQSSEMVKEILKWESLVIPLTVSFVCLGHWMRKNGNHSFCLQIKPYLKVLIADSRINQTLQSTQPCICALQLPRDLPCIPLGFSGIWSSQNIGASFTIL